MRVAAAYSNLGALAFLNDTQEALDAYRNALRLNPNNTGDWNRLGILLKRVGDLDGAEEPEVWAMCDVEVRAG